MTLARLNPTVVFLGALAVVLAGLFLPGAAGGIILLVLAAGLGAIMTRTWPVTPSAMRVIRLAILTALVVVALSKIF